MNMILLENYKCEIEKLREHLHDAIRHKDKEIIITISKELDELIIEYMKETIKK